MKQADLLDSGFGERNNPHAKPGLNVKTELGGHRIETFLSADLIVVSPGVPLNIESVAAAREKGIEIISEIELACRFIQDPVIGITGTNGKTTTTLLLGNMLKASNEGLRWRKCG